MWVFVFLREFDGRAGSFVRSGDPGGVVRVEDSLAILRQSIMRLHSVAGLARHYPTNMI